MKAVYIQDDMPDRCSHCDLWEMAMALNGVYHHYCIAQGHKMLNRDDVDKCLDETCPLRPLPERFEDPAGFEELQHIYGAKGWNDCLDAITGGKDESDKDNHNL